MPLSDYSIIDCMERSELFGPWFSDSSWARWKIVLKLLFGLPLAWSERSIAKHHLGYRPTREAYRELWLQVGRRGGKTSILALIAVYIACFKDFSQYLQPGEWATVIVISPGRDQAADVLNRIRELLRLPLLEQLIARDTDDV